jgi:hypothetical protein
LLILQVNKFDDLNFELILDSFIKSQLNSFNLEILDIIDDVSKVFKGIMSDLINNNRNNYPM